MQQQHKRDKLNPFCCGTGGDQERSPRIDQNFEQRRSLNGKRAIAPLITIAVWYGVRSGTSQNADFLWSFCLWGGTGGAGATGFELRFDIEYYQVYTPTPMG